MIRLTRAVKSVLIAALILNVSAPAFADGRAAAAEAAKDRAAEPAPRGNKALVYGGAGLFAAGMAVGASTGSSTTKRRVLGVRRGDSRTSSSAPPGSARPSPAADDVPRQPRQPRAVDAVAPGGGVTVTKRCHGEDSRGLAAASILFAVPCAVVHVPAAARHGAGRNRQPRPRPRQRPQPRQGRRHARSQRARAVEVRRAVTRPTTRSGCRASRIAARRPENWEQTIKRMISLNKVALEPADARTIIKYLSDNHGLAPEEARPVAFEAEHRLVDVTYDADKETAVVCSSCHSIGRVMSERRTKEEWDLLLAMHRGYYPLVDNQPMNDGQGFRRTRAPQTEPGADGRPPDNRQPMERVVEHLRRRIR